jgi:electron transport complex protein RnfB
VNPAPEIDVDRVDALLPQTQCTQCGYAGCRPYAEAIVRDAAPINRCPPGGSDGIARLAALLGRERVPLDPACGAEAPRQVARIVEADCIGCTKCIQACPVDAIIGVGKRMHTVLPALCSGCALCVPPCPTDCIRLEPLDAPLPWSDADAEAARTRYQARRSRLLRERADNDRRLASKAASKLAAARAEVLGTTVDEGTPDAAARAAAERRAATIEAAMRRARARIDARARRHEP